MNKERGAILAQNANRTQRRAIMARAGPKTMARRLQSEQMGEKAADKKMAKITVNHRAG